MTKTKTETRYELLLTEEEQNSFKTDGIKTDYYYPEFRLRMLKCANGNSYCKINNDQNGMVDKKKVELSEVEFNEEMALNYDRCIGFVHAEMSINHGPYIERIEMINYIENIKQIMFSTEVENSHDYHKNVKPFSHKKIEGSMLDLLLNIGEKN